MFKKSLFTTKNGKTYMKEKNLSKRGIGDRFLVLNEDGEQFWLTTMNLATISKGLTNKKFIQKNVNILMEVDNP